MLQDEHSAQRHAANLDRGTCFWWFNSSLRVSLLLGAGFPNESSNDGCRSAALPFYGSRAQAGAFGCPSWLGRLVRAPGRWKFLVFQSTASGMGESPVFSFLFGRDMGGARHFPQKHQQRNPQFPLTNTLDYSDNFWTHDKNPTETPKTEPNWPASEAAGPGELHRGGGNGPMRRETSLKSGLVGILRT